MSASDAPSVPKEEEEPVPQQETKSKLHGLVVATAHEDHVTVLCGSVPMLCRVPVNAPDPIVPGCWVNFEMDLSTGENQIVTECKSKYRTYIFDDGTFSVLSPATFYLEDDMDEDELSVAYTPFFRFVEDPEGIMQDVEWMEWYQVLLGPCSNGAFLLQVQKIVRDMAGCIEPGSMPGQMPTREQIEILMEKDAPRGDYKGVEIVNSCLLGLCIGPAYYDRTQDSTGKYSSYGSARGGHSRNDRYDHQDRRGGWNNGGGGGWNNGGRGGWNGGRGGGGSGWGDRDGRSQNYGNSSSSNDWRGNNGHWRVQERQAMNNAPNRQHQRGDDITKKTVKGSLIFTQRGIVIQKLESESYKEGDWLVFDKTAKSDTTIAHENKGRTSYPPYILQHKKMKDGYGGECRVKGKKEEWKIQVKVQAEFRWLRNKGWFEPSFFGRINCTEMMFRLAKKRLEEEKMGWAEMSEKEQDTVMIHVWIGMTVLDMATLPGMNPYPREVKWTVQTLDEKEFIHDLPLDKARAAGALAAIVF